MVDHFQWALCTIFAVIGYWIQPPRWNRPPRVLVLFTALFTAYAAVLYYGIHLPQRAATYRDLGTTVGWLIYWIAVSFPIAVVDLARLDMTIANRMADRKIPSQQTSTDAL